MLKKQTKKHLIRHTKPAILTHIYAAVCSWAPFSAISIVLSLSFFACSASFCKKMKKKYRKNKFFRTKQLSSIFLTLRVSLQEFAIAEINAMSDNAAIFGRACGVTWHHDAHSAKFRCVNGLIYQQFHAIVITPIQTQFLRKKKKPRWKSSIFGCNNQKKTLSHLQDVKQYVPFSL